MNLLFPLISYALFTSLTLASFRKDSSTTSNEDYKDACTTIMYGWDQIQTDGKQHLLYEMYAEWQNQPPNTPFLGYFENDKGMISKLFFSGSSSATWRFSLTFNDGKYIDTKFAKVDMIEIDTSLDISIDQQNGTFKTTRQDFMLGLFYGEDNNEVFYKHLCNWKEIRGQLSIYFMDKETLKPFTNTDDIHDGDVSKYTVQLQFVNFDQSFSFITSLFSPTFQISTFDAIFTYILSGVYILVGFFARYTPTLDERVSTLSAALAYISSAFIVLWILTQLYNKAVTSQFSAFFAGVLIAFLIRVHFLTKKSSPISLCIFSLFSSMCLLFSFVEIHFPLPLSLIPCLALIPPLVLKAIQQRFEFQFYLTRFEISQWICVCLWIGYTHLYPNNFFLLSPKPIFFSVFFLLMIIQLVISLFLKRTQRRRAGEILIANQFYFDNIPNPRAMRDEDYFRYSFVLTDEDRNVLSTKVSAVCLDNLISEQQKLYKTPCNHFFHQECLRAWGAKKLDCPCCRKRLPIFRNPVNQAV